MPSTRHCKINKFSVSQDQEDGTPCNRFLGARGDDEVDPKNWSDPLCPYLTYTAVLADQKDATLDHEFEVRMYLAEHTINLFKNNPTESEAFQQGIRGIVDCLGQFIFGAPSYPNGLSFTCYGCKKKNAVDFVHVPDPCLHPSGDPRAVMMINDIVTV